MGAIEGEPNMAAPVRMEIDWGTREDLALLRSMKEMASSIRCLASWFATDGSWSEIQRLHEALGFYRDSGECKAWFALLCSMHREELADENGATLASQDDTARGNREVVAELRSLLPMLSAARVRPAVAVRDSVASDDDDDDRGDLSFNGDPRRRNRRGSSSDNGDARRRYTRHGASSVNDDDARPRKLQRLAHGLGHKVTDLAAQVRDLKGELRDLGGEVREIGRDARELETATAHLALTESRAADRRLRRARPR